MPQMVIAVVLLTFLFIALGAFVAAEFFIVAGAVLVVALLTGVYLFRARPQPPEHEHDHG